MKILILNSGSSSVKYQLFDMTDESVVAKGLVERIGMNDAILTHQPTGGEKFRLVETILEHTAAITVVLDALTHPAHGVLKSVREIDAVGHRVVHGGEKFSTSAIVTNDVIAAIEDCIEIAPLHNPPNLKGILAAEKAMPGVPQVAVFDTAFHATLPPYAYLYALPYSLYERYRVRRYGFHGTSHKFVALRVAQLLHTELRALKLITCHLGNGASITAIDRGKSVDTSMGFTPLEGLVMGTRSGDIDPAIIPYIMAKEDITMGEVDAMLNKHSGMVGISGVSSDMRDIETQAAAGNHRAQLALEIYAYRIRKYIGAYAAAMDGVDVIVFTAGIGENSVSQRKAICSHLGYLGAEFDEARNHVRGHEQEISAPASKVKIWTVPTNEELMIARETLELVKK